MQDTKPKSIWYVISHLGSGGTERHIATLIPLQLEQGYAIRIVVYGACQGKSYHAFPDTVEIIYLQDRYGTSEKKRMLGLRQLVRTEKPDFISTWNSDINVRVLLALLGLKAHVIVSEVSNPIKMPMGIVSRILRLLLYPLAKTIVVQTKQVKRYYPPWLWPKLKVINNPINIYDHKTLQMNKVMISAGRLSVEKRFDILIQAFALVIRKFPDWQLCIWGEGPERQKLEQLIQQQGLAAAVRLPGNSPAPSDWLGTGQIFTMCSAYEGFPNALGEAMANGYPVVVTPFNFGPRDMIIHGVDGWVADSQQPDDLAQALMVLMQDENLAGKIGQQAKEKAALLWNRKKIVNEWLEIFI